MSTTIDQLQIEIESNSKGAVKNLSELKSELKEIDKIAKSSGLDRVCSKLKEIAAINFSNLNSLNALGKTTNRVSDFNKKVDNLTSSLSDLPENVKVTTDASGVSEAASDVVKVSNAIDSVPDSKIVEVDAPNTGQATVRVDNFHKKLRKVSDSASRASVGVNNLTNKLHRTSSAFGKATRKASMFKDVLKIVVVYGGAFRAFMLLTQGVSEGLQNVAQYNAETAASMGRLSTMSLTLKNSIGASLYPVLVALTPVLQSITNAIVRVCEGFSMLISLMSGKSTYLKAKTYAKSYVDTATKAGADAAKAIKKSFAGMDEITTIGNKDTGSSGGSGGGGGDNYGEMFEEAKLPNSFSEILTNLEPLSDFAEKLGLVMLLFGKLKTSAALIGLSGVFDIIHGISKIVENGFSTDAVLEVIGGLGKVGTAIGIMTGHWEIAGIGLALSGITDIISQLSKNWEAIKKGDWSGVDKVTLIIGGLKLIGGLVLALIAFKTLHNIKEVTDSVESVGKVATATETLDTNVGRLSPKLSSLAKNLGIGLIIITEVAVAAVLITGAIWLLGKELEQVGIAWQPVIANAGTVAIAMGVGVGLLAGIGVATALLGSVGTPLIVNMALGVAILAEIGVATGLFLVEIWAVGKGLTEIGIAWQPVLDNGESIATAIGIGTGLLIGIGVVTAALGVATVASAGALPLAIGIGTALLVELAAAFVLFTESLITVANQLSDELHPALERLNGILPDLSKETKSFKDYMIEFAEFVVAYTKHSAISGFSATVDSIIKFFTKDPIKALAKDVNKQYEQSVELNKKLRLANPELETAITLIRNYYTLLEEIERLTGKTNTISLKNGMFVSMKEVGKNLVLGFVDGIKAEYNTLYDGVKSVLKDTFTDKLAKSYGEDFGKQLASAVSKGFKQGSFPTLKGSVNVNNIGTVSLKLRAYATGGFPEDGLFMANHGELIGEFSDGRTAVANNEQIVEGIKYGVYAANQEQNVLLREQNKLLRQIVDKESGGAIDVTTITKAMNRKNQRDGKTIVAVGV